MRSLALICGLIVLAPPALADTAPEIWSAKCKSCHAEDGSGKTKIGAKEKVDDLSSAAWQSKTGDADIQKVIAEGSSKNNKMKAFKDKLSAGEIQSLVAHIRSLKK